MTEFINGFMNRFLLCSLLLCGIIGYILRHPQAFGQIVGRTFAVPPLAPPAHSFGGSFSATVFFSHPGRPDPHFSGNLIFHFRIAENQG